MPRRFATKDVVTAVVQAFLARPALFEYAARRLEARDGVRETMGLVMGDLAPASRALDPRFLAALRHLRLAPPPFAGTFRRAFTCRTGPLLLAVGRRHLRCGQRRAREHRGSP